MKSQDFSRRALGLSLAVYRITGKFPSGEVLIKQMRELGNEIAGDLAAGNLAKIEKKINRLRTYFKIAQAQNWVKPINWQVVDFEYYKLAQEVVLSQVVGEVAEKEESPSIMSHNIDDIVKRETSYNIVRKIVPRALSASHPQRNFRQNKIMAALNRKEPLKMSDLIPLFKNDISERTLRNELQAMVKNGLIKKSGVNKATTYFKM
jgi:hypothetical protein